MSLSEGRAVICYLIIWLTQCLEFKDLCLSVWSLISLPVYLSPTPLNPDLTWTFIFLQRIQLLITPSDTLPKTKREQERLLAIFAPEGEAPMTKNGYYPVSETDSNLWGPCGDAYRKDMWVLVPSLTCCTLCLHLKYHCRERYNKVSHHPVL